MLFCTAGSFVCIFAAMTQVRQYFLATHQTELPQVWIYMANNYIFCATHGARAGNQKLAVWLPLVSLPLASGIS
jgi:hypothetical protein